MVNYGSGRPFNATVAGDPNQDGNDLNDRLPGYSRNAFTGPDYATADLRLTRNIRFRERYKLNLVAESFNLFNRDNQRVTITSNGLVAHATRSCRTPSPPTSRRTPATTSSRPIS